MTEPTGEAAARVRELLHESAHTKQEMAQDASAVAVAAALVTKAFREGHKVLLFGNGGSAADAQHIAAEWSGRLSRERAPLPAMALTTNSSEITALANDYGYEAVFARLVRAHARPGDVVIAISTSGNSPNVLQAVDAAREIGARSVAWTGRGGGKLAEKVDCALVVPSKNTQRIQEVHITLGHIIAELVDDALFPDAPPVS